MNAIDTAALVFAAVALASWANVRLLRLPPAAGLLLLGLSAALTAAVVDQLWPAWGVGARFGSLVDSIDYSRLVLNAMLAWLLFAGAMNVDLDALRRRGWATGLLATAGTLATAALAALGFWMVARAVGRPVSPAWASVFGVIVSPTDPVAVLAMTRRTTLQPELRAQLEGEALFNDGVAVVLFGAAVAWAGGTSAGVDMAGVDGMAGRVAAEALGGATLGLAGGLVAGAIIHAVDDWATETLVTLAVATVVYAAGLWLGLSGPIGVVVAGLITGSRWVERGMSEKTRRHIHPFWRVVDEGLNAILFLGLGLEAWTLRAGPAPVAILIACPLIVLAARWASIGAPVAALRVVRRGPGLDLVNVLTWAGVRGGLSMAMALSLPATPGRALIVAGVMSVATFSILVQSLTVGRLAVRTGYARPHARLEPGA